MKCTGAHELISCATLPEVFLLKYGRLLGFSLLVHLSMLAAYHTLYLLGISRERSQEQLGLADEEDRTRHGSVMVPVRMKNCTARTYCVTAQRSMAK
jgi:hypothetical protein